MTRCDITNVPTKDDFLTAYRAGVVARYGSVWAHGERLEKFMASVHTTLFTDANTWNKDSEVARAVWKSIGCKGPMTYKALKGLPA
jgi:hypothetical protein